MSKTDYCTCFPEEWRGQDISDCCKLHDDSFSTRKFYKCLKSKIGWFHALYITAGGAIGLWFKYTSKMIKRV